ncbi:MAG: 50S ribosomal protein L32 [Alphaproteobacteria bacterium]|nr:MAG: 50S ribosomal protein L32 [Alphaproteobacteria bacterium]
MAVPKKKTSKSARNMRRSHHAIKPATYGECENCGVPCLPHHVCKACGHYSKRQVFSNANEGGETAAA